MTKSNKWIQYLALEINEQGFEVTPQEVKEIIQELKRSNKLYIKSTKELIEDLVMLVSMRHQVEL